MSAGKCVAVFGAGNLLSKDDGIGIRVIRELARSHSLPRRIRLYEGVAGSFRLLSEIDHIQTILIVDAVHGGGFPGSIYHLSPEKVIRKKGSRQSLHAAGALEILRLAGALGARPRARILGVEPEDAWSPGLDLSPAVRKAVPEAVQSVVTELRAMGVRGIRKSRGHAPTGRQSSVRTR